MEVGGGGDGGAVGGGGKLGGGGTVVELRRNLENPSFWALDFRFQIFLFWVFFFLFSGCGINGDRRRIKSREGGK